MDTELPLRRGENRAAQGPREEATGGVRGCTLRMADDRERRDATVIDTELLPPLKQRLWGRLAVVNFFLGGAGAGAYLVAVSLTGFSATPLARVALTLGPLLVLAGFLAGAVGAGGALSNCRGVRAWNVPTLPLLFLASALVSGAGVLSLAAPLGSGAADRVELGKGAAVLPGGFARG